MYQLPYYFDFCVYFLPPLHFHFPCMVNLPAKMEITSVAVVILFLSSTLPLILSLNQEGLYLQGVKNDLHDPTGTMSSWSDRDSTPCNWTGIKCNSETHSVVSLILPSASLSGPFPTFLCRLPSLSKLSLSNNSINSSLPSGISLCRNLIHLDLSQNLLTAHIPPSLADLPNLRYLNLDGNNFSGDIPSSFGRFRILETLILTENLLNGTIPGILGNITSLKSLELAYNPFAPSQLSPELGNLTNLEYLWLSGCNLVGSIPEGFGRLSRLTNLDVSSNRLVGSIPSLIFQLKSVVQIELFNNSFTGELPAGWSNLTALRRLDVSMNNLIGMIPDKLCELPLESLNLNDNQLVGSVPDRISKSPNLYEFKLFNNRLTGSLPSQLGLNSPLQILDLSCNKFTGEIPATLCEQGALVELILIHNSFTGSIPAGLGNCQSLSRVRLKGNRLSGEVQPSFWGLPHIYFLDLCDNSLSGSISTEISAAKNLSTLSISNNKFSGIIPKEIGSLENLVEFSGANNQFSGQLPDTLVNLRLLGLIDLDSNMLSGKIPKGIESLKQLNELNLANNRLSGELPDKIGSLSVLNYLDLSGNYFSGKIPPGLQNLRINKLNLSNNQLSGEIPPLYAKEVYRDSFVGNPGLCGDLLGLCPKKGSTKSDGFLLLLLCIFLVAGVVFVAGIACFMWKYWNFKKMEKEFVILKWRSFHKLGFIESEILECLYEGNVIGRGASGKVYKAALSNGDIVAVKKLWERSNKDEISFDSIDSEKDEFEVEVETLGNIRHKNIVRLLCCCKAGNCKVLVYEYMPNGSLGDLLHSSKGSLLDWPRRFRIALDAAKGLSYLHHDCVPPIIHRDVKSNNVLLDGEFGAKISDFGVAKFVRATNKGGECMSVIAGSCGYIAPEYAYTLRVNEKSDIYSFGMIILELVTGRQPISSEFVEKDLTTWVRSTLKQKGVDQVLDPNLDPSFREQICRVLNIGLLCTNSFPINRPSMRTVVKMLQEPEPEIKLMTATNDGKSFSYYCQDGSDQGGEV